MGDPSENILANERVYLVDEIGDIVNRARLAHFHQFESNGLEMVQIEPGTDGYNARCEAMLEMMAEIRREMWKLNIDDDSANEFGLVRTSELSQIPDETALPSAISGRSRRILIRMGLIGVSKKAA